MSQQTRRWSSTRGSFSQPGHTPAAALRALLAATAAAGEPGIEVPIGERGESRPFDFFGRAPDFVPRPVEATLVLSPPASCPRPERLPTGSADEVA